VVQLVDKLRNQSFHQHFYDSPLISEDDPQDLTVKKTVVDFINWQIDNNKSRKESLKLQKLVWIQGYDKLEPTTPYQFLFY